MPRLSSTKPKRDRAEYFREYRRRQKAGRETREALERQRVLQEEREQIAVMPARGEPIDQLAVWAQNVLKVPPGHHLEGQPMTIPEFGRDFLRDALAHRESLLCLARKNAKSAIVAVYLLGRMVGPLYVRGWRGAVCSVTKAKAGELKTQMQAIAEASGLRGLTFLRSPTPGRVEADGATLDILAADAGAGHASGFDDAVVDETGLLQERDRGLVNGLRSSTSARNGRVLHLSIWGSGPFVPELVEASDDPSICVHLHQADEGSDLEDSAAWAKANPGLGSIKSVSYMEDRSRLASRNPNDAADFMAHDLNRPGEPSREMIATVADWNEVASDDLPVPERRGPVCVGLDAGGSSSMTAACCVWPLTGRMEVRGAFPNDPDLQERGRLDGVGRRYEQLHALGEIRTYPGRSTPVVVFLRDLADDLQGETVISLGADRFRQSEVQDAIGDAVLRWPLIWRGQGASATADGSADVRSFQRAVQDKTITVVQGRALMAHAISESAIRRDGSGNPALEKGRQRGRIDPLSAAVIACGLAERHRARMNRQPPKLRYAIAR